ncbi:MAG: hypothetical protein J6X55_12200 [Victivallales bacterium]|nr:hypothetical protein [Victivallales bacterium]
MAKIAIIGAGGVIFTQNLIKDILLDECLKTSQVTLMDIDAGRLANAGKMSAIIAEQFGVEFHPELTTDLHQAVRNADYVFTVFSVGELKHQRLEYEIPAKYGVKQVVSDTLGPGGVFRGLRTLKALFEVVDAMEEECPGAYLLNYVNPMSLNIIALNRRAKTIKIIGLCHSVQHTVSVVANYLNVDRKKIHYVCAGVNHQAFFLKLELDGQSLYPALRKCLDKPEIYNRDKVRFEMMREFGYFPTESSGHGSEYVPYFRKRDDLLDKYCCVSVDYPDDRVKGYLMSAGVSGASLIVCQALQEINKKELEDLLNGTKKITKSQSVEYGIQIISAIERNVPFSANLNVMNHGLIPTLPPAACVEVPCLVSGGGVLPCKVEDYPEQLAALNRNMINVQLLGAQGALNCDRESVFHAIATDPLTAAVCSLAEIRQMTNELFEALKDQIAPAFF